MLFLGAILFRLPFIGHIGQGHPLVVNGGCPDLFPHRFVDLLGPPVLYPASVPRRLVDPEAIGLRIEGVCVANAGFFEREKGGWISGLVSESGLVAG